jgi:hypothetical protein
LKKALCKSVDDNLFLYNASKEAAIEKNVKQRGSTLNPAQQRIT